MLLPLDINIIVGCEESQAVCIELRKMGFNAFSCDTQESSGGYPQWHIKGDIKEVLNGAFQAYGQFWTEDETAECVRKWHCGIFFPPCTHLAVSGASSFEAKRKDGRQQEGIDFFMKIATCNIKRTAIENPIGIMSTIYRKPDQIINPFYFGDPFPKKTCLWLQKLPKLDHNKAPNLFYNDPSWVEPQYKVFASKKNKSGTSKYSPKHGVLGKGRGKERSKTEPGFAKAMAEQWGGYLLDSYVSICPKCGDLSENENLPCDDCTV